jgi:CheY-like chemotaxis protein/signal transduction histidine kinase/HAMP domain-containing protein
MKITNLKIGTRLTIGFMLVILLTLAVGGMALRQMRVLAYLVSEMYDHPLTVGYTMREIRLEINQMQDQMQRLLIAGDVEEPGVVERDIQSTAARVLDKFAVVEEWFLGDKDDLIIAQRAFSDWKNMLDQEIEMVRAGDRNKPDRALYLARLKISDDLQGKLQVVIDFADRKARSFRDMAGEQEAHGRTVMVGLLGATLLLSLGIAWFITRSIAPSLQLIVQRMQDIAKGDLRHEVNINQKDEIGVLAETFREMQNGLRTKVNVAMAIATGDLGQRVAVNGRDDQLGNAINQMTLALHTSKTQRDLQDWIKTGKNELNRIIVGQGDLKALATQMLGFFAGYLDAQIGTLYVLSDEGVLNLHGSYAAGQREVLAATIAPGEGLVGQAALSKEIISITSIPPDYLRIGSSLGDCLPRDIVCVPLLFEDTIKGVIELGCIEAFSEAKLDFLRDTSNLAAIAVHTVQNQAKRKQLLEQTQQQAGQMQVQEEELRVANEELEEQTRSLRKSEEQLRQQQEELRTINEELEEKNQYLEEQKQQNIQKNQALENARRELERRARELEVTSKYKSEFLANMSHELRTPLNSLLLLSRDLEENAKGNLNPDQVESAGVIHKGGLDLLQLINEVLDLSKIEAGRMTLKIDDVDLAGIARNTEQSFKHIAAKKGLLFKVSMTDNLPQSIKTDGQRLQQILNNMVANALKFTEQGSVTIVLQKPSPGANLAKSGLTLDSCVAFSVTDSGIGIPSDKQSLIFEAFQQADSGTSRKYGGTGLGLSIARELAKLLGGEIQLSSAPGQGSVFTLYLPFEHTRSQAGAEMKTWKTDTTHFRFAEVPALYTPPEQHLALADDREEINPDDRSILIIEDDADFSKILLEQCHAKGFKALIAPSGEAGLALAEKLLPTAVILDIRLPGMSGCTVLRTLKKNPATRHIPVHVITVEETSLENLQGGAIGFTTKPVNRQELEEAFESIAGVVEKKIKDLLLVEDSAELRLGIVNLISDPDLNIVEVETGADALAALKERSFDCMVLDLGLPDMTGFELLKHMGAGHDANMPPVIVYTGKELTREEEVELRKHAESIIIKGVKSEERLLDEVSLFLHKTVSAMPPAKREMIITLHERDAMFSDKTILLVDDDMRNLFALSKILTEKGLNVLKAEDGRKALKLLESHAEIALVLLDIMMPVMDGYQTAREIRKQPRFYDLPVIALTAKALKEDRHKCIAAGANDYLSKPVDVERLFSTLRVWLYRRECIL